jgi:hypothetical protein
MLLSETDKLSVIEKKLDLGIISRAEAISIDREIDIKMAAEALSKINADDLGLNINDDKDDADDEESDLNINGKAKANTDEQQS